MSDGSTIEWLDRPGTKPATWNPIRARNRETGKIGWFCVHVHEGCKFCYAEGFNARLGNGARYVAQDEAKVEIFLDEKTLLQPLKWKHPRTIFVCSMTDLYGPWVKDEWLDKIKAVQALTPQHTYIELTKRPERMRDYATRMHDEPATETARRLVAVWPARANIPGGGIEIPLPNVWGLVSCSTQEDADKFVPILLNTPLAIRGVSAEPLLGPIDFTRICLLPQKPGSIRAGIHVNTLAGRYCESGVAYRGNWDVTRPVFDAGWPVLHLDWVIIGGESGRNARSMHPDWARPIVAQCEAAGVACFFKQWGEFGTAAYRMDTGLPVFRQFTSFDHWVAKASTWVRGGICLDAFGCELKTGKDFATARDAGRFPVTIMHRVGKKLAGRLLDGAEHNGFPA